MNWTIIHNGVEKTLAEWGVNNVRRLLSSQAMDALTFRLPMQSGYEEPVFAEKTNLSLQRDGVQWFYGRIIAVETTVTAGEESHSYTVAGPWWWLDQTTFQQPWNVQSVGLDVAPFLKSHLLLNYKLVGNVLTKTSIGEQIAEAVAFAIADGAPILLDETSLPLVSVPDEEAQDLSCAEVVSHMLRWVPDAVTFFDYSTTPPTLKIRRRSELANTDFSVKSKAYSGVKVKPRGDMQKDQIALKYERQDEYDGTSVTTTSADIVPPGSSARGPGALVATIKLQGSSANYARASISTRPIAIHDNDWWKAKCSWLGRPEIRNLVITPDDRTGTLANELIDGVIAPWMNGRSERETITGFATFDIVENEVVRDAKVSEPISFEVTATNLHTGSFSSLESFESGELPPVGLAAAMYAALSPLNYDGSLSLVEEECSGQVPIGSVLNLLDANPAWASMRATVQEVAEDIDSGSTTVTFGWPRHLDVSDILDLLRMTRWRQRYTQPKERQTGRPQSGGAALALGDKTPAQGVAKATGYQPTLSVSYPPNQPLGTTPVGGGIQMRVADCMNMVLQVREYQVCDNGKKRYVRLLGSMPYDTPFGT